MSQLDIKLATRLWETHQTEKNGRSHTTYRFSEDPVIRACMHHFGFLTLWVGTSVYPIRFATHASIRAFRNEIFGKQTDDRLTLTYHPGRITSHSLSRDMQYALYMWIHGPADWSQAGMLRDEGVAILKKFGLWDWQHMQPERWQ